LKNKIACFAERDHTWSKLGAFCLMFCAVCPAATCVFAQQAQPSVSSGWDKVAPSNSSTPPAASYSPMTKQERWKDYEDQNFASYGAFFQAFFTGLGDSMGNVPQWDSGMSGLSEHVGSEFARFAIGGTIHFSLAASLHEDTRYFHCSCQGGFHRTVHAVGRTFFTYGDNGRIYPDISGLAGIYGGPMLATQWYPAKYSAFGYGVQQGNIALGITSAIYVIREFSPEIKRAVHWRNASERISED